MKNIELSAQIVLGGFYLAAYLIVGFFLQPRLTETVHIPLFLLLLGLSIASWFLPKAARLVLMWTVPIPLFYLALNGERSSTNQMLAYIGMGLCLMEIGMAIVGLRTEVERNKAAIAPDSTQR